MVAGFIAMLVLVLSGWSDPPAGSEQSPRPAAIDLRPVLANWTLPPRAQGPRGTCSVFAVTHALEYAVASATREPVRLSPEYLNWASNQAVRSAHDGGFFSDLWKGYEAAGICSESLLPYRSAFDAGLTPSADASAGAAQTRALGLALHWIKPWDVKTGLTPQHLEQIKSVLAKQWPVCAGLRWPKRATWTDRVLDMREPKDVFDGHSVLLVGYRDDAAIPGGGVFYLRDSGSGTDDELMTYEYAAAYMNDAAWIAPEQPSPVNPAVEPEYPAWLMPTSLPPAGRNQRVSSNQQPAWNTENLDMTWLQPGQSIRMPDLTGPGVITHMWFTSHAGWAHELNALTLRITFDDHAVPDVEVPLGDFFAVGQGTPATVESVPVQVSPTGALSCYWRMPFRSNARLEVVNDNTDRGAGLYWQVDYVQTQAIPQDVPYFRAGYRREYPARAGSDYVLADLTGRGMYVGSVMSITMAQPGWYGEGDDFFFIDGEEIPSLQGTGSEDYFNDAWGLRPRTSHWFGSPRWQGDSAGDSGVCYRWHLPDPVMFSRSLVARIEHKGNSPVDTDGFFVERPDFFSSVALWYQFGPPQTERRNPLPSWNDRRVPWVVHHFVRSMRRTTVSAGRLSIDTSGLFGARPVLKWSDVGEASRLAVKFNVPKSGRYAVRLTAATSADGGSFDALIDGARVQRVNTADPAGAEADVLLGTLKLPAGDHEIAFQATDRPGPLMIETLRALELPPEARREAKTHHEAHFVRLAIGRAIYAYRLAYDRVPDSLKQLVEAGVLDPRYTRDENGQPLTDRREGEFLVVESTSGEKWTHRWQGLDARR